MKRACSRRLENAQGRGGHAVCDGSHATHGLRWGAKHALNRRPALIVMALAGLFLCGAVSASSLVSRVVCRDLLLGQSAIPASTLTATVLRTTHPPVIDGDLSDPCWQAAKPLAPFRRTDQNHLALVQTQVRLAYDNQKLYIGIHCDEPHVARLTATHLQRDSDVWRDDDVEIFLCPNDDRYTYYQLMVNSRGGLADARYEGGMQSGDKSWNAPWEIKTKVGTNSYTVEIAVPFSAFGLPGAIDGARWDANFCRTNYADGKELSAWSRPGFHDTDSFGEIVFGSAPVQVRLASLGRLTWGANQAGVEVRNNSGAPIELRGAAQVDEAASVATSLTAPPGVSHSNLAYRVPRAGVAQTLHLRVRTSNGKPLLWVDRPFTPPLLLALDLAESKLFLGQDRLPATVKVTLPPAGLAGVSLRVRLLGAAGKEFKSGEVKAPGGGEIHLLLNLSGVDAGSYQLRADLLDRAGKTIESATAPLAIIHGPF